jgi:hypothetical protein
VAALPQVTMSGAAQEAPELFFRILIGGNGPAPGAKTNIRRSISLAQLTLALPR